MGHWCNATNYRCFTTAVCKSTDTSYNALLFPLATHYDVENHVELQLLVFNTECESKERARLVKLYWHLACAQKYQNWKICPKTFVHECTWLMLWFTVHYRHDSVSTHKSSEPTYNTTSNVKHSRIRVWLQRDVIGRQQTPCPFLKLHLKLNLLQTKQLICIFPPGCMQVQ